MSGETRDIERELAHYKGQLDELAGENLRLDYTISGLRHELRQKRQGFALLSELQQSIGAHKEISSIFEITMRAINSTLGMDKTIVLSPTGNANVYRPSQWLGAHAEAAARFETLEIEFPATFGNEPNLIMANGTSEVTPMISQLRAAFELPFFICLPVIVERAPIRLLMSGRTKEARPIYPPLDQGDADTFKAITGLISASIQNMRVAVLTEMDRLKTEFFANISHEFRTPITLTLGPLQQVLAERHGTVPPAVRSQLKMMLRNQERLLDLVNQLLDLAKFESGGMKLRAARIADPNGFIGDLAVQFQEIAKKRGLELKLAVDHRLGGVELYLDREHFSRLVSNLLSNAVKFTNAGTIEVATSVQSGAFRLSVSDTGIGIKTDELPYVFDRFRQADSSVSREYSGTGIGLALVKEIAALHGGDVTVRSQYGKGTVFDVTVPFGRSHLSPSSVVDSPAADTKPASLHAMIVEEGVAAHDDVDMYNRQADACFDSGRPTILYADDNADLRVYVRQLLAHKYNVILAVDGRDGLEKARRIRPDLILSDQMMPQMSGRMLLAALRKDSALKTIPVVFLTARAGTEARVESLEAGADDYLAKPFDEQELLARVDNLLRARAQERELAVLNATLEERVRDQVGQLERLSRLKRCFSPQLADLIVAGGADDPLKSHRRELAVVFIDLRGFTAFAEISEPEEVMTVLREYHVAMGDLIHAHEGTLERFTGDGMVVFFNDPLPVPNAAERAVRMAAAMRESVAQLSEGWRKREYRLDFGVGLAQGYATIGAIGFEARWDYGAIGSVINLASRLCDEAKPGQILMSRRILTSIEHLVEVQPVGELALKGFHNPIAAYNLVRLVNP